LWQREANSDGRPLSSKTMSKVTDQFVHTHTHTHRVTLRTELLKTETETKKHSHESVAILLSQLNIINSTFLFSLLKHSNSY